MPNSGRVCQGALDAQPVVGADFLQQALPASARSSTLSLGVTRTAGSTMTLLADSHTLASRVDRPTVRIALAVLVGLPAAWFGIVYGYLGLAFGLGGLLERFELIPAALVTITAFGLLGILGGWIRLLRRHSAMGDKMRRIAVGLLWCGVISAVCLAASAMASEATPASFIMAAVWTAMAVIGMVLIHATPARNARQKILAEGVV